MGDCYLRSVRLLPFLFTCVTDAPLLGKSDPGTSFVSIGCPGRPFATAQPKLDDLLPSDDAAWDDGVGDQILRRLNMLTKDKLVKRGDSFTLSSPSNAHMSKFALLCQAARLLGQVLDSVSRDWTRGDNDWIQLDRTLQSMVTASLEVELPDYDQIAFAYRYVFLQLPNQLIESLAAPSLLYTLPGFPQTALAKPTKTDPKEQSLQYSE